MIIAHRTHPNYHTLAEEVYDCGHTHSVKPHELGDLNSSQHRCVKCVKQMPVELTPLELKNLKGRDLSKMQIIERLYESLDFHLSVTEKSRSSVKGNLENIDNAIKRAQDVLEDAGFVIGSNTEHKSTQA